MAKAKKQTLRDKVRIAMSDGQWLTGLAIARRCGREQYTPGIASKVRDLRKPQYGGHIIERRLNKDETRRTGAQVYEYKMVLGETKDAPSALPQDQTGQCLLLSGNGEGPDFYSRERRQGK